MAVFIINCNDSCPTSPLAEAVINPVGFSEKTVVAMHHSIAFFKPLGMLNTYSGVQMRMPSACAIRRLKSTTSIGGWIV